MKMTYQRDNKRKNRHSGYFWYVCLVLLVVITLLNFFAPHFFSPVTHAASIPFAHSRNFVGSVFKSIGGFFSTKSSLQKENDRLQKEVAIVEALKLEKRALDEENTTLKKLLGKEEITYPVRVAEVLSKPGFSPYDTIVIDAGAKDGLMKGEIVLADRSVVLGEVAEVYPFTSTVLLYSSPEQKTDVFIGTTSLQTTATGKGGGNYEIRLPRNANVAEGDIIRLTKIPDKIFGSVQSIEASATDSFVKIFFRTVVDISDIRFITVEKLQI